MTQILIVGDIHGCYDEFQALLDAAELATDDGIISLGDFVDRGPASPAVLSFFTTVPQAQALMGNHERKHMRHTLGEVKLAISQEITRRQFAEEQADYATAVAFMGSLPLYLDLPDALLVHGYVEPGVPLSEQRPTVLCGTMGGDKYLAATYERPWYELYDRDKPVIVGHANYGGGDKPFIYQDRVFGLDTDCYRGRRLTGLLLPSFRIVSVPARCNHWAEMRRLYRPLLKKPLDPAILNWAKQKRWLTQIAGQKNLSPDKVAQVAQIRLQREQGVAFLPVIFAYLQEEHRAVLAQLHQSRPDYNDLPPRIQGRMYNEALGDRHPRERNLLHQLRVGTLTTDTMPRAVRSASQAIQLAAVLNLSIE